MHKRPPDFSLGVLIKGFKLWRLQMVGNSRKSNTHALAFVGTHDGGHQMSSLRPAKIVASFVQLIGGSLAEPAEKYGPSCSCEGCVEAWRRNQSPNLAPVRARVAMGRHRAGTT
jgi:hypothetical protein